MKKIDFVQDNRIEGVCVLYNQDQGDEIMELKKLLHFYLFKIKVRTPTGNYVYIKLMDIYYIEVVDGQCFVCGEQDIYKSLVSFKELRNQLDGNGFIQCNKTQMINECHLEDLKMEKDCQRIAKLDNGDIVLVSRRFKNIVDEYKQPHRAYKII